MRYLWLTRCSAQDFVRFLEGRHLGPPFCRGIRYGVVSREPHSTMGGENKRNMRERKKWLGKIGCVGAVLRPLQNSPDATE